jgi:photosystem II stability/assembly factor-like uncharacterized protein
MKSSLRISLSLLFLFSILFVLPSESPGITEHGLKWIEQHSGTAVNFRGVCAVNVETAWVSGPEGTVMRTVDSGKTWLKCSVPPQAEKIDFRDIQAFDAETAIVMGVASPARFYKTTDGGKSWKEVYTNEHKGIFFNSMAFWDNKNGIAFSDPIDGDFFLLKTGDSGESWQRIPPGKFPKPIEGEAAFAASGTMITVYGNSHAWFCTGGTAARVFRSTDNGERWTVSETPMLHGSASQGSFSIVFADEKNGVIVGGDYQKADQNIKNAAFTLDGGKTWQPVRSNQPGGYRECVVYIPAISSRFMVTVGPSGSDYSVDGGQSWKPLGKIPLHSLSMVPGKAVGWAVGPNGQIAKLQSGSK